MLPVSHWRHSRPGPKRLVESVRLRGLRRGDAGSTPSIASTAFAMRFNNTGVERRLRGVIPEQLAVALNHGLGVLAGIHHIQQPVANLREIGWTVTPRAALAMNHRYCQVMSRRSVVPPAETRGTRDFKVD
jgi:hypothetical protein